MAEIEVKVFKDGRLLKKVSRPVHVSDGVPEVTYKGSRYPLRAGNAIEVGSVGAALPAGKRVHKTISPEPDKRVIPARGKGSPEPALLPTAGGSTAVTSEVKQRVGSPSIAIPDKWDPAQLEIINAPATARLLIDAGPGTGKTAVACRRVAELINAGDIAASRIWMISFTRTAVREISDRLSAYVTEKGDAAEVRIATLDSHAWAIHSGFDKEASLSGTYEDNISRVRELVRKNEGVFDYLSRLKHLVIDEAQDIVGVRSGLILEIISRLPADCGITVFADEAQSIYGFADEDGRSTSSVGLLPEQLRANRSLKFRECVLSNIHRTDKASLVGLYQKVRSKVLAASPAGGERLGVVKKGIRESADSAAQRLDFNKLEGTDSTFVLFRRRADALRAASMYAPRPHRLRMGGYGPTLEPWIAIVFRDWTESRMDKDTFLALWGEWIEGRDVSSMPVERAWQLLVRIAGESRGIISRKKVRERLSRSSPPLEFCRQDFGVAGPVFGTIHGCKGREADTVFLEFPPEPVDGAVQDPDEEARVLFVGATRAKANLQVANSSGTFYPRSLQGGRIFAILNRNRQVSAQVEIGKDGDLLPGGLAGKGTFKGVAEVMAAQDYLRGNANRIVELSAVADRAMGFAYMIQAKDGPRLGAFDQSMNKDFFAVGQQANEFAKRGGKVRPSNKLAHLRSMGSRTLVLPNDIEDDFLHEPWSESGFLLAPLVTGFDMVYFTPFGN